MSKEKGKASWDVSTTELFIKECLEQIYQKQRQGTSFTKVGWNNITAAFNTKAGKSYDKKQLKNRLDSLRKDWRTWDALSKETGIGWDPTTNTVVASNEWWEKKKQENAQYEKFRYNGLRFARELTLIFKGVMASGEEMLAPSSTQAQEQQGANLDDVYRPEMDLQEGSGDNEEDLGGGSAGFTDELAGINLTNRSAPSDPSSGTKGKRKRDNESSRKKKLKMLASRQIADSISVIATASRDRAEALKKINDVSVSEVRTELLRLQEIRSDFDLRTRCLKLMMYKICREMFVALRGEHEYLIEWLREMAYNPPSWLEAPPT